MYNSHVSEIVYVEKNKEINKIFDISFLSFELVCCISLKCENLNYDQIVSQFVLFNYWMINFKFQLLSN